MKSLQLKKDHDIVIIGPYPPPYGGISVHLERLIPFLDKLGYFFILYNISTTRSIHNKVISINRFKTIYFIIICLFKKGKIFHLYSPNWYVRLIFAFFTMFRKGKFIISIQGPSISDALKSKFKIRGNITKWIINCMDKIIACNNQIKSECIEFINDPNKVLMIPAFIPPLDNEIDDPPKYILDYIRKHSPTIVATGWIGVKYDGDDDYGIDMLIYLVQKLILKYPEIGLIIKINGGTSDEIIEETINSAFKSVGNHILFINEPLKDVVGLYKNCDLFCRPTKSEGDAVSVRESLFVGTPVIASNVGQRPKNCFLFESRNFNDLYNVTIDALSQQKKYIKKNNISSESLNSDKLLKVYNNILTK